MNILCATVLPSILLIKHTADSFKNLKRGGFPMDPRCAPAYAGFATFLRARTGAPQDLKADDVGIYGMPFDTTCGSRQGARFGPRAIREESLHFMYQMGALTTDRKEMVNIHTGKTFRFPPRDVVVDTGDSDVFPADVARTAAAIEEHVFEIARRGALPVGMGGDHYVTYPAVRGVERACTERFGRANMGYVHIDAHLDLTDDTEAWGRHYHGSIARRVGELPGVDPRRMVWIGTGGSFQTVERWEYVRTSGATVFNVRDIDRLGIDEVVTKAGEIAADGADGVYVTVDIDVVDHAFAPGTGSFVFGGVTSAQFLHLMEQLARLPVLAIDLVEVAPDLDPTGGTQRLAAMGIITFLMDRIF